MKKYFKYCAKNNTTTMSFNNGKERLGYKVKACKTEAEERKAIADGWVRKLHDISKTKKVKKSPEVNDVENSAVRSGESTEGSGPVDAIPA